MLLKIGLEQGERRAKEKIARKLLDLNTPLETIMTIRGLLKEEIDFLSKN